MTIKNSGNRGEWSEVYTFLKLLGDGKLYGADAELNQREDIFYNIIEIIRCEEEGILHFEIDSTNSTIQLSNEANDISKSFAMELFSDEAKYLLEKIKESGTSSFEVVHTNEFMNGILCKKLKAPSQDKSDITIKVHDFNTNLEPTLGFSIKSRLGKPSTLLNAGKTTNFIFEITGGFYEGEITSINDLIVEKDPDTVHEDISIKDRILYLKEESYSLVFSDMENKTFKNNLVLMDSDLPEILANLLIQFYVQRKTKLTEALAAIKITNPLRYDVSEGHDFYEYKIKKFLVESALGMLPSTVWTGKADANGGYIVVREDGEVLCYHLYNRNDFEDYLLNNTRFEQASTTRHDFGTVYKENGKYYIKLNLQIRFIK